jgi:hypothetical protein
MSDLNQASEREAIEMLLPFYVMGKLDPAETARVDAYLDAHPEMRAQLVLIEDERVATVRDNEAIVPPATLTADALLAQLPRSTAKQATTAVRGAFARFADLLRAPDAAGLRWAAAALVALVAVQAITVGTLMTRDGPGYELASGGANEKSTGTFALVRFKGDATFADIRVELKALELTWIEGPNAAGLVTVRIADKTLSQAARDERITNIRTSAQTIGFITPKGGRE